MVFTLLCREDIRLTQGKAVLGCEPEKPLKIHGLRKGLGQIRVAVAKREKPIQILERHPCTTCCALPFKSASTQVGRLDAVETDQLRQRTLNLAHSELLSQQMGVMQERMDAFSAMRTSAASSLNRIPAGIGQDEALQENEQDQHRQD